MLLRKERLDRIPARVSVASEQLGEFPVSEARLWVENLVHALDKAQPGLLAGEFPYGLNICGGGEHTYGCPSLVQCLADLEDKCYASLTRNSMENLLFIALLSTNPQLEKEKQDKTKFE